MATWADCKGPTPGPKSAVSQHKTMASGYELPSTPRRVDMSQRGTDTGSTDAPGLTTQSKKR